MPTKIGRLRFIGIQKKFTSYPSNLNREHEMKTQSAFSNRGHSQAILLIKRALLSNKAGFFVLFLLWVVTAHAQTYVVQETGQTTAYDENGNIVTVSEGEKYYGQDAHYEGTPQSFQDNGDGTVSDLNTGLTWLQQPTEEEMDWYDAKEYCENLMFAGRDDWRMPTLTELYSIENFGDGWPYIDMEVFSFGNLPISKDLQFWSSNFYKVETEKAVKNTAFGVNFGTGHIKGYGAGGDTDDLRPPRPQKAGRPGGMEEGGTASNDRPRRPGGMDEGSTGSNDRPQRGAPRGNPRLKQIWAVAGEEYGVSQFVDNGDGTVSDLGTGLMWMVDDSGEGLDWESALAYCENLEFAGHDDWKLPNVKELQTLVDYSGVYPAIDENLFNITDEDSYFWTSTSAYHSKRTEESRKRRYAWYVAFGYATGPNGEDHHGAGAVRYDAKTVDGPTGENANRVFNYARAVRVIK